MVTNKHIEKIITAVMAAAVLLCFALMLCAGQLAAAAEKGITSLSSIAMDSTTDRYSFKLEFDQYVKGQTCFGLDKLILNNNYADATNMKESLVYDMYHYIGADASLSSFARISVNGEYRGVYLALEAVEDSFLLRNYGTEDGRLYKPESMNMGGGGKGGDMGGMPAQGKPGNDGVDRPDFGGAMPDFTNGAKPDFADISDAGFDFSQKGGFGGMGGCGANLNYTDDDLDSYSTIWESAVNSSGKADHKRVVTALKNIAEGTDLARYMDIDNLLKYMAVHVFSVNEDSLSGMMAHNYYLYEHDGRLNLIPWDYNLILGGMGSGGNASGTINDPIDTPFSATKFFDKLLENEQYLEKYHSYLQMLTDNYVDGGGFDAFYERTRQQIDALVAEDPTAFYSGAEYEAAAEVFYQAVNLRSDSVQGQLSGEIPSTSSGQRSSDALVSTDGLDLSVMGTMNMGGGGFGGQQPPDGQMPDFGGQMPDFGNGQMPDPGELPEGFTPPADGQMPAGMQPPGNGGNGGNGGNFPGGAQSTQTTPADSGSTGEDSAADSSASDKSRPSFGGQGDGGRFPSGSQPTGGSANVRTNLITIGVSFGVLLAAIVIAKTYRRKNIRK